MKEKDILVIIKEPGKEAYVEPCFENTLEAFQKAVGGYIETLRVAPDAVLICNEEGLLKDLPRQRVFGHEFAGTVVFVRTKGEEFASLKSTTVSNILYLLK